MPPFSSKPYFVNFLHILVYFLGGQRGLMRKSLQENCYFLKTLAQDLSILTQCLGDSVSVWKEFVFCINCVAV